jgi:hypothetical protein
VKFENILRPIYNKCTSEHFQKKFKWPEKDPVTDFYIKPDKGMQRLFRKSTVRKHHNSKSSVQEFFQNKQDLKIENEKILSLEKKPSKNLMIDLNSDILTPVKERTEDIRSNLSPMS